jgi:hypothetical protein
MKAGGKQSNWLAGNFRLYRKQVGNGKVDLSSHWLTLKMEVVFFSETSTVFQQTTWHYIPEDSTLHNHRCENLKSYIHRIVYTVHHCNLSHTVTKGFFINQLNEEE